jgi:hypothetical protein
VLVWFALKNSFGPSLQRRVQPDSQIRLDEPPREPGSDNDTGLQGSPHQFQVGQEIINSALGSFSLDLFKREIKILRKISKRVVDHFKTQGASNIVGRGGIATPTVAGNGYL